MAPAALVAELPALARSGWLAEGSPAAAAAVARLADAGALRAAGVAPLALLAAAGAVRAAGGAPALAGTLADAFGAGRDRAPATGRRLLVALDGSSSMWIGGVAGMPALSPAQAAAAMVLTHVAGEPRCEVAVFTQGPSRRRGPWRRPGADVLAPLAIRAQDSLGGVAGALAPLRCVDADLGLPMRHARERGLAVDVFVVYTDAETWARETHPRQALAEYRRACGIDARLVVVALAGGRLAPLADPSDGGVLAVSGFGPAAPAVIEQFIRGSF